MFQDPVSMYFIRPVGFVSKLTELIHILFEWSHTINPNFSILSRGHQRQQDGNTHSTAVQGQAKCPSKACISFPTKDAWHRARVQDHSTVLSPRTEPWHVLGITHRLLVPEMSLHVTALYPSLYQSSGYYSRIYPAHFSIQANF